MFPSVSVVVPTYREAENLPELLKRLDRVRQENGLHLELLIMDDNSQDGIVELVESLGLDWVRLVVRVKNRDLSLAVIDGLRLARHKAAVVMDADLSHPPEKIPEMIRALEANHDFVIGSRYESGGSTDAEWSLFRWLNSKIATLLARPFTNVHDPMAGFFALRLESLEHSAPLNPVGYKIGLELIVKCGFRHICEIPIRFTERRHGQSKMSLKQQFKYVQHLCRLFIFKYGVRSRLFQLLVVGLCGAGMM